MPKKITEETRIKKEIKQYLLFSGWFVFPVLQGMGAYKGISDFIAVKNGVVLFVEVKAPRGIQSNDQIEFQRNIELSGGHYLVARGWQDVSDYILKIAA